MSLIEMLNYTIGNNNPGYFYPYCNLTAWITKNSILFKHATIHIGNQRQKNILVAI